MVAFAYGAGALGGPTGIGGLWFSRVPSTEQVGTLVAPVSDGVGIFSLLIFILLLVGLPLVHASGSAQGMALFDAFYRSGALEPWFNKIWRSGGDCTRSVSARRLGHGGVNFSDLGPPKGILRPVTPAAQLSFAP